MGLKKVQKQGGNEITQEDYSTREKSLSETSFQLGMGLKIVQKQDRDERTQEEYVTSAVHFLRRSVSLLVFFHLCLVFCTFFGPSLTVK